jgi:hypothetical protein
MIVQTIGVRACPAATAQYGGKHRVSSEMGSWVSFIIFLF